MDDNLRHPVAAPKGAGRFAEVDSGDLYFAAIVGILSLIFHINNVNNT